MLLRSCATTLAARRAARSPGLQVRRLEWLTFCRTRGHTCSGRWNCEMPRAKARPVVTGPWMAVSTPLDPNT
eukprot:1677474-Alexandrium_andersonii.AAC.1